MDFKTFLAQSSEEELSKLAEEMQDEMVEKVANALVPLLEKTAEYTAYLILEKLASDVVIQEHPGTEEASVASVDNGEAKPGASEKISQTEISGAAREAIEAGSPDKVVTFIKTVFGSYGPEFTEQAIKTVKTVLHDIVVSGKLDEATASKIAQELDAVLSTPVKSEPKAIAPVKEEVKEEVPPEKKEEQK